MLKDRVKGDMKFQPGTVVSRFKSQHTFKVEVMKVLPIEYRLVQYC